MRHVTAGPGDEATWGPITSMSDPRAAYVEVTFPAIIGISRAEVEVTAEVWNFSDNPLGEILRVEYAGVDILETLDDSQFTDIERSYETWEANRG